MASTACSQQVAASGKVFEALRIHPDICARIPFFDCSRIFVSDLIEAPHSVR